MKLIFDLDGTLIDISERHWTVYSTIIHKLGHRPLLKPEYWNLKRENIPWPEILKRSGLSKKYVDVFLPLFVKSIESPEMLSIDTTFDYTFDVLNTLKTHELYLVSLRRNDQALREQLHNLKLSEYFIEIQSGHTESEGYHKKNEIISSILNGDQAIVVGDTETDVLAAKQLGIRSIAVSSGIRSKRFLNVLEPDELIPSIKNLPKLIT